MLGVIAHLDPFLLVERGGFLQHIARYAELADIVEKGRSANGACPLGRKVHSRRHCAGQLGHTFGMSRGERALRVDDLSESGSDRVEEILVGRMSRSAGAAATSRAAR